jgi:hypothetical protein
MVLPRLLVLTASMEGDGVLMLVGEDWAEDVRHEVVCCE